MKHQTPDLQFSFESLQFQSNKMLEQIAEAISELRKDDKYDTESINKVDIPGIVKNFTGLMITFDVLAYQTHAAYIRLPQIDRNHPFIEEWYRNSHLSDDLGVQLISAMGGKIEGGIDSKTGRVSGVYTKIRGDVFMGMGLLKDKTFTDAELAAVIGHEVGHLWTYFKLLGTLVYSTHVMGGVAKSMLGLENYKARYDTLVEAERVLGVDLKNKDKIAAMPNAKLRSLYAQSIMISAYAVKSRSETGLSVYEMRSCEQLADQFVVRFDGGRDLALALDKLYRKYWSKSAMNTATYTFFECIKLIMFLAGLFLIPVILVVYLLLANPTRKIYDDPEARIRFIKQQMVEELKDKDLDKSRREQVLSNIEAVEMVEGTLDDKRSLMELFWTVIMPSGRSALREEEAAKEIEALLSNDLYTQAAKFKQL